MLYRFLRAVQQNRAQSRLLYLLIKSDEEGVDEDVEDDDEDNSEEETTT